MPKSKTRKKPGNSATSPVKWGAASSKGTRRINLILGAIAVSTTVLAGFYFWQSNRADKVFSALAEQGRAVPSLARTQFDQGGGHLAPGAEHDYNGPFPTSGIHDPSVINPGFYSSILPPTKLVHSLEHGHIVIYYETPGPEAIQFLKDWSSLFDGHWDGVIAVPATGLGKTVLLSAWTKTLRLEDFNPPAAAAFIDRYRGRGPENPVR